MRKNLELCVMCITWVVFGLLCAVIIWCIENTVLASILSNNVTRTGPNTYHIRTAQGEEISVGNIAPNRQWLVAFDRCQVLFTVTAVAEVNGIKTIVVVSQDTGKNSGIVSIEETHELNSFSVDLPCAPYSVKSISFNLNHGWEKEV